MNSQCVVSNLHISSLMKNLVIPYFSRCQEESILSVQALPIIVTFTSQKEITIEEETTFKVTFWFETAIFLSTHQSSRADQGCELTWLW